MKKTEDSLPLNRVLAFPILTGLAAVLLVMLLGAVLVKLGRVGMDQIPAFAVSALCFGVLLAAFLSARRASGSRLFWGLGAGAAVLLCIALLSLSWFSEPVSLSQLAVNSGTALLAAFLGAFIGSRRRRRRRRRPPEPRRGL